MTSLSGLKERTKRTTRHLFYWTLVWLITLAIATFGPKFIWNNEVMISGLMVAINLMAGIGMIRANIIHVKGLDELQQKVQLEAMGITLGVTLVAGIAYTTLDITNVIPFDAEISFLVMLMGVTYMIALVAGTRRYQ